MDFLPKKEAENLQNMVEKYFGSIYGLTNSDELIAEAASQYSVAEKLKKYSPDLISFAERWFFPNKFIRERKVEPLPKPESLAEEEIRGEIYELMEKRYSIERSKYEPGKKVGEIVLREGDFSYWLENEWRRTPCEEMLQFIKEQGAISRPIITDYYFEMLKQNVFIEEAELIPISDERFLNALDFRLFEYGILLRKKVK